MTSNFQFQVDDFCGDSSLVNFFFDQILTYEKLKGLSRDETVAFLKSKLKGPARQYMIEDPVLYKATDFEFIQNRITDFFAKTSAPATLNDLNTLTILPHESIKNFAHRLNVLVTKVYPEIIDKDSSNHIKYVKFLSCLPSSIRRKLLEEDVKTYPKAVERAQVLQDIFVQDNVFTTSDSFQATEQLQSKIAELTEKINNLNFAQPVSQKKNDSSPVREKKHHDRQNYQENYKTRHNFQPYQRRRFPQKQTERCQLCFRYGHSAKHCFKWQRANTKLDQQDTRYKRNYSDTNYKNLNSK